MEECCICGEELGLKYLSNTSPGGSSYVPVLEQVLEEEERDLLCLLQAGDLCPECSEVIESIEVYLNKLRLAKLRIINAYNEHITKERSGEKAEETLAKRRRLKVNTEEYSIYEISYESNKEHSGLPNFEPTPSPPSPSSAPPSPSPSSPSTASSKPAPPIFPASFQNSSIPGVDPALVPEEAGDENPLELLKIELGTPGRKHFSLQLDDDIWNQLLRENDDWKHLLLDILSSNIKSCDMELVVARKPGFSPLFTGFCKTPDCSRSLQVRPIKDKTLAVEVSDGNCVLPPELSATVFCDYCLQQFKSDDAEHERDLRDHLSLQHGREEDRIYSCSCSRTFRRKGARNYHYKRCGEESTLPCDICGKMFRNLSRLELHYKLCKRDVMCEVCSKIFSTGRRLEEHMYTVHGENSENIQAKREYPCDECGKVFRKKYNLQSHQLKHSNLKPFACQEKECGKLFKREVTLRKHIETLHNNKAVDLLSCSFCPAQFKSASGLRMHGASVHEVGSSNIRRFGCNECGKAFKCMADLKAHSVTHSNIKAFSCDVCGGKFARKNGLLEHMNIHKMTYKCDDCGKCFGRDRYLTAHRKTCQVSVRQGTEAEANEGREETVIITKKATQEREPAQTNLATSQSQPIIQSSQPQTIIQSSQSQTILQSSQPQPILQSSQPQPKLLSSQSQTILQSKPIIIDILSKPNSIQTKPSSSETKPHLYQPQPEKVFYLNPATLKEGVQSLQLVHSTEGRMLLSVVKDPLPIVIQASTTQGKSDV